MASPLTSYLPLLLPPDDPSDSYPMPTYDAQPPFGVATWLSPTSVTLSISNTQGDPVRVYWRGHPTDAYDKIGPRLTGGDGDVVLGGLPEGSGFFVTLVRETYGGLSRPYTFSATTIHGDSLAGAIGRLWGLTPHLTSACGQLFTQEAPETLLGNRLQLPWTILCYDSATYDWTTESVYFETTKADLTTYALGYQLVEDALAAIHVNLDWQSLPFVDSRNNHVVKVEPLDYMTATTFVRHKSGQMVWHGRISYLITIQRHHPRWPRYPYMLP